MRLSETLIDRALRGESPGDLAREAYGLIEGGGGWIAGAVDDEGYEYYAVVKGLAADELKDFGVNSKAKQTGFMILENPRRRSDDIYAHYHLFLPLNSKDAVSLLRAVFGYGPKVSVARMDRTDVERLYRGDAVPLRALPDDEIGESLSEDLDKAAEKMAANAIKKGSKKSKEALKAKFKKAMQKVAGKKKEDLPPRVNRLLSEVLDPALTAMGLIWVGVDAEGTAPLDEEDGMAVDEIALRFGSEIKEKQPTLLGLARCPDEDGMIAALEELGYFVE